MSYDRVDYRERDVIERSFVHLQQWRGLATCYDKLAVVCRADAALYAVLAWTRHLGHTLWALRGLGLAVAPSALRQDTQT